MAATAAAAAAAAAGTPAASEAGEGAEGEAGGLRVTVGGGGGWRRSSAALAFLLEPILAFINIGDLLATPTPFSQAAVVASRKGRRTGGTFSASFS